MTNSTPNDLLHIRQQGDLTVVEFGNPNLLDTVVFSEFRERLRQLIEETHPPVIVFDVTDVALLPSGVFGCLASLTQLGIEVQLYHPSERIREVLEITRLDSLIKVREEEL